MIEPVKGKFYRTSLEMVYEFHDVFGVAINDVPQVPPSETDDHCLHALGVQMSFLRSIANGFHSLATNYSSPIALRMQLMTEELAEVGEALLDDNPANLLKELSDLQYVIDGTYLTFGLHSVKHIGCLAVHVSNMSKLDENGRPIKNKAGRVVKGPNYAEPDMQRIIDTIPRDEDNAQVS